MSIHPQVEAVTAAIVKRSAVTRRTYLDFIARERENGLERPILSCGNLAHAFAASGEDKAAIRGGRGMNIAVVTAYNDMLSAHQPYGRYPEQIKLFARELGMTAQVAGGVPAMCDGVTQGQDGMELSLFSRDTIALATAIALTHGMFEGALLLGICDKIVPGLLLGALRFGHLPMLLIPAGPMPSGLPNNEKQRVRELFAEGKAGRDELLDAEAASYHAPGTCTFYGTANSNQVMMEVMGLHVPGAAFVNPGTPLRQALTREAVVALSKVSAKGDDYRPLGRCIDEKAIVNAVVGLLATGGSTNHAIHLPAIARAAGIILDWEDIDRLSAATPLIARVYPNGPGDVNQFQAAGGTAFVIGQLLQAGLLHNDVLTVVGKDLSEYAKVPRLAGRGVVWDDAPGESTDLSLLRPVREPFAPEGGLRLVQGNLGRATFKTSAVDRSLWTIEAPARVFTDQHQVVAAFKAGELDRDVVVVIVGQGPQANGMPELHKLTPTLGLLQDRGFKVALVTDGRMSGASGKVPAAIHLSPEAARGGPIGRVRDGDLIRLCAVTGQINAIVNGELWQSRNEVFSVPPVQGAGREIFAFMRHGVDGAEQGASAMLSAAGL